MSQPTKLNHSPQSTKYIDSFKNDATIDDDEHPHCNNN